MKKQTKVLLSIEPQLCKELLKQNLASFADVEIVGESCNFIECVALISQRNADIWIHSSKNGPDLELALSRVYDIAPDLVIVRFNPQEPTCMLQVQVHSVCDLLDFTNQWKPDTESAYSH